MSKKKSLAKKLKEKEEAAVRAAEEKRAAAAEAAKTPEEKLADKLRAQQLAQESDLEVAKDTFGESGVACGSRFLMSSIRVTAEICWKVA